MYDIPSGCINPCSVPHMSTGLIDENTRVQVIDMSTCKQKYVTIEELVQWLVDELDLHFNAIELGAGLESGGDYLPNESTNYLKTADFSSAGRTPSLKTADELLDARIASLNLTVLSRGMLPPVIDIVAMEVAPPTLSTGDTYLIMASEALLTLGNIAWQSGIKTRYYFTGTPTFNCATGDYLQVQDCVNPENDGVYLITNVNQASYYIDVNNGNRTSAALDETPSTGIAYWSKTNWGAMPRNSHVTRAASSWTYLTAFDGLSAINIADNYSLVVFDETLEYWKLQSNNELLHTDNTGLNAAKKGTDKNMIFNPVTGGDWDIAVRKSGVNKIWNTIDYSELT